jgi:hypothetical protein
MINTPPPRPTGTSREAHFMQWVYDTILALRPIKVPHALVSQTTRGVSAIPRPPGKGGAVELNISMYQTMADETETLKVKQGADYVWAYPFNGTSVSGAADKVAKPFEIRESVTSEITNEGVTLHYTYPAHGERRITGDQTLAGLVEVQFITPEYIPGQIIVVATLTEALTLDGGETVDRIDLSGRVWGTSRTDFYNPELPNP